MDAEELKFNESSFDLICEIGILHYLKLEKAYSELQRVVKKDGVALFIEPLGHNPFIKLYRKLTPRLRTLDEHPLLSKDLILAKKYFDNKVGVVGGDAAISSAKITLTELRAVILL